MHVCIRGIKSLKQVFDTLSGLYCYGSTHRTTGDYGKSIRQPVFSSVLNSHFLILFRQFSTTTAGPAPSNTGLSRNRESTCTI